jgi:hypothetical protein
VEAEAEAEAGAEAEAEAEAEKLRPRLGPKRGAEAVPVGDTNDQGGGAGEGSRGDGDDTGRWCRSA